MKRPIKFRGWDKKKGTWFKRTYKAYKGDLEDMLIGMQGDICLRSMSGLAHESTFPNRFVLSQFTGLLDKNGKEIYEGDILCVFDEAVVPVTDDGQGPIEPCNHIVSVEMRNGVWGFEIPRSDDGETGWYGLHYWIKDISSDGYEVLGNIYEHPNLLTQTL